MITIDNDAEARETGIVTDVVASLPLDEVESNATVGGENSKTVGLLKLAPVVPKVPTKAPVILLNSWMSPLPLSAINKLTL